MSSVAAKDSIGTVNLLNVAGNSKLVIVGAVVSPVAGGGVQACVNTGCVVGVPVHPAGVVPVCVLVCCPFTHADHPEYVYPVHVAGGGVQACVNTGCVVGVPVHPAGVVPVCVLVCCPFTHADHPEYVYPVHAIEGVLDTTPGNEPARISAMFVKPSPSESLLSTATIIVLVSEFLVIPFAIKAEP